MRTKKNITRNTRNTNVKKGSIFMKKIIALTMAVALSLTLFGCGKKNGGSNATQAATTAAQGKTGDGDYTKYDNVTFQKKENKLVFTVNGEVKLKQGAWLGFCPGTKGYVNEVDADEVDVLYSYICNENHQDGEDFIFEFDEDSIGALEDGDYVMVLCDDDDEGKVILYVPAVIKGKTVTVDFEKVVVNK